MTDHTACDARIAQLEAENELFRLSLSDLYDAVGEPDHEGTLDAIRQMTDAQERLEWCGNHNRQLEAELAKAQQAADAHYAAKMIHLRRANDYRTALEAIAAKDGLEGWSKASKFAAAALAPTGKDPE
jgi:hypothetical protein